MRRTPNIDTMKVLGASIQEAAVTVTADTEAEANKIAGAWLLHHANKDNLVLSFSYREGIRNADGTMTMRYF
ncbi:hypothetical protein [Paenarthrobacter sp. NPDC090522]|uniref:hypothetical protein n=1 Tax=Paenarthrobacter sp. NPDC090522 TaxID=3364383 RepID=UPI00380AA51E